MLFGASPFLLYILEDHQQLLLFLEFKNLLGSLVLWIYFQNLLSKLRRLGNIILDLQIVDHQEIATFFQTSDI